MPDPTPAETLEKARQVAREQWREARYDFFMDALPPLAKVMSALGIEPPRDEPE